MKAIQKHTSYTDQFLAVVSVTIREYVQVSNGASFHLQMFYNRGDILRWTSEMLLA